MALIKGNANWLGLPELTLKSECPTRWNSFLLCIQRMVKIHKPLNVTLDKADRQELVLDKEDIELMKDLIQELEPFHTITNMLCTNTQYSFSSYWPMKLLIENMLSKPVDVKVIFYHKIIKEFRGIMLTHFQTFDVSENSMRLAKTALMLDPCHMIQAEEQEISPFIEHVLQILDNDVPHACASETQMVGPSQPLLV